MAKVNTCLKRSFIFVIALNTILCAVVLGITLLGHGYGYLREAYGGYGLYGVSIVPLFFTSLGLYGACKEKLCPLIVFAVAMILGCLAMIKCEITALVIRPKIVEEIKRQYLDRLPLANASESFLDDLTLVQYEKHCCGLIHGYQDWGYNISTSCLCQEESTKSCVIVPENSSIYDYYELPVMIYEEPCFPHFFAYEMMLQNALIGVVLGIILLWGIPLVLSIFIMCQLNQKVETPAVVYSEEAKAGNYAGFT